MPQPPRESFAQMVDLLSYSCERRIESQRSAFTPGMRPDVARSFNSPQMGALLSSESAVDMLEGLCPIQRVAAYYLDSRVVYRGKFVCGAMEKNRHTRLIISPAAPIFDGLLL